MPQIERLTFNKSFYFITFKRCNCFCYFTRYLPRSDSIVALVAGEVLLTLLHLKSRLKSGKALESWGFTMQWIIITRVKWFGGGIISSSVSTSRLTPESFCFGTFTLVFSLCCLVMDLYFGCCLCYCHFLLVCLLNANCYIIWRIIKV